MNEVRENNVVEIQRRTAEARAMIEDMRRGQDFMLPMERDLQGSVSYWKEIKIGLLEMFSDGDQGVEAVKDLLNRLEQRQPVEISFLENVKDAINRTVETYRESPQKMAA